MLKRLNQLLMFACTIAAAVVWVMASVAADNDALKHPLSDGERANLKQTWDEQLAEISKKLEAEPENVALLSRRGDVFFFRGEFANAVRDYERMSELDPKLDASHWRLGIAYFYAGQPEKSARQFDKFFVTDDVDREAGLWKYIAQAPTTGTDKARDGLLKYKKDDREPLPAIYRLFQGEITPNELLESVDPKSSEIAREQRLFYIELYLGLWHDAHKRPKDALPHFHAATANRWGRTASYGPNYMWHVARLHYERLADKHKP